MKKAIGFIVATVIGFSAQSSVFAKTLPYGDIAGVSTIFPVGHTVEASIETMTTQISLGFTLQGCVDKLGDVVFHSEDKDGQLHLYVAGQNIASEASKVVRCIVAPHAARKIRVEGVYSQENVIVHKLEIARNVRKLPAEGGVTCMAYWSGYVLDEATGTCKKTGRSGCSNPFEYLDLDSCMEAYGLK